MPIKLFSKAKSIISSEMVIVLIAFCLALLPGILLPSAETAGENFFNDIFFRCRYLLTGRQEISPGLNVFNLDDRDVEELGLTLFSRQVFNEILDCLSNSGTKAVIFDILFKDTLHSTGDQALADLSGRAGNVYFPLVLKSETSPEKDAENRIEKWLIYPRGNSTGTPYAFNSAILPFKELSAVAAFLGAINNDSDNYNRMIPLVYQYNRGYIPSLILLAALAYYDSPLENISIEWGKAIVITDKDGKSRRIPIDKKGRMRINYPAPYNNSFPRYSFRKVREAFGDAAKSEVLQEGFRDSLIFIVDSTTVMNDFGRNVYDKNLPLNEVLTAAVNTILTKNYLSSPGPGTTLTGFLFWLALFFCVHLKAKQNKLLIIILLSAVIYLICSFLFFIFFKRTFNFILFLGIILSAIGLLFYNLLFLRRLTESLLSRQILSGRYDRGLDLFTSLFQQLLSPLTIIENSIKNKNPDNDVIPYLELAKRIIRFLASRNRLQNRQLKFGKPVLLNASSYIEGVTKLYRPYAVSRGIELSYTIEPGLLIEGIAIALEMLFILLIEHFIHISTKGDKIELSLKAHNALLIINILNTGSGLPESLVEKINNKRKNAGKKWMLYKNICAALNAEYKVSSWKNAGTRIEITLPNPVKTNLSLAVQWPLSKDERSDIQSPENRIKPVFYIINLTALLKKHILHFFDKEYIIVFLDITELNPALFSDSLGPAAILFDMDGINPQEAEQEIEKLIHITEKNSALLFLCGSAPDVLHYYYIQHKRINGFKAKPFSFMEIQKEFQKWFLFRENCFNINQENIKNYFFTNFAEANTVKEQQKIHKLSIFTENALLLKRLLEGKKNTVISEELNVSINTLKKRIRKIYKKCKVKNKSELIAFFRDNQNF